jgi:hypothetical protein
MCHRSGGRNDRRAGERISTLTRFDNSGLGRFGLPRILTD